MFLLRPFPAAVLSLLLGCVCAPEEMAPTADELHELSLEELLEIPIETVRSAREDSRCTTTLAVGALVGVRALDAAGETGTDGVDEYQLKAAFIAKFVKYVTWPAERLGADDAPLVIGVFGQDPFGDKLELAFKSRKADERPIAVRRFQRLEELQGAHVLFVPARDAGRLGEILRSIPDTSLLLIGESDAFAARGGVINFYLDADKLRFEINTESAKRQKLRVSSDLLKLARIVSDKG